VRIYERWMRWCGVYERRERREHEADASGSIFLTFSQSSFGSLNVHLEAAFHVSDRRPMASSGIFQPALSAKKIVAIPLWSIHPKGEHSMGILSS
jgi:hypothetical protein